MIFRLTHARTLNEQANRLWGRLQIGLQYLLFRSGPMSMSPSQLGAFARSDPTRPSANLEYHVQPLSLDRFGEPLHDFPAFTVSVCNLQPRSRGRVSIVSADPFTSPRIAPNYLSTPEDREVAVDSLRLTRRIVQAQALQRYEPEEWMPGASLQTNEELAEGAGAVGTTIFHPVGTCRMGPASDPMAVVDCRLRCHGIDGLRIVDASIMPRITSGNTNSPTLMIAEKGAEMILQDRKTGSAMAGTVSLFHVEHALVRH